ncbi:hypothetical protein N7490_002816 [Penicillium lividum]|nr:hypothetical protein N7490_002816 [Penicillium lividum]
MPSQKPDLPPLKTPKSFTFPSEIQDDPKFLSTIDLKREDSSEDSRSGSASSIPTPSAYTDFLDALTPIFNKNSPRSPGGAFPKIKLEKCGLSPASQPSTATSPVFPYLKSPVTSIPSSESPCDTNSPKSPPALRRLRIPHSIKTKGMNSPLTATPLTATPRSASSLYSPFSPADWKIRYFEAPKSATPAKSVSVRQVVTRTITYKRTPLDPPPKGKTKRRKTQERKEPCKDICKESLKEACKEVA